MDQGLYYIFIEEKLYVTKRGPDSLSYGQSKDGNPVLSSCPGKTIPSFLSFHLKYNGQLYLIPETAENNQIELYRCIRFPDQWIFEKPLMQNIKQWIPL